MPLKLASPSPASSLSRHCALSTGVKVAAARMRLQSDGRWAVPRWVPGTTLTSRVA